MRFLIEVAYRGTAYAGFQVQENANTIQYEVEKALSVIYRQHIALTGSSRTDSGVHALQNFFHTDTEIPLRQEHIYNLNALLPADIVIKRLIEVPTDFHCRFQASYRRYQYHLYQQKNPFYYDRGWFYPYPLQIDLLQQAATVILEYTDFTSFSKRNTQVKTKLCAIMESRWERREDEWVYTVKANRFLRGMVRGLVGTMLLVGRQKISLQDFRNIIEGKDCTLADFTTPAQGLFLVEVGLQIPG